MSRHKLSPTARANRNIARDKIIQEANRYKMRMRLTYGGAIYQPKLFGPKDIQHAVYVCRQHMLVSGKLLIEAGYTPHAAKARHHQPTVLRKLLGK